MGIVKFGQQNLSIEQVPDGHIIISDNEFARMRDGSNAYLSLRSKIPTGIAEDQISPLIDKGLKFDNTSQEVGSLKTKISELEGNLNKFSNIPKDYTPEKWDSFVKKETTEKRSAKFAELSQKALVDVEKEFGVKFVVDERFIPADIRNGFDPFKDGADKEWKDILDKAHTEQQNFIQNQLETNLPSPSKVGNQLDTKGILAPNKGDIADFSQTKIGGFH